MSSDVLSSDVLSSDVLSSDLSSSDLSSSDPLSNDSPPMKMADRLERLRAELVEAGVDAAVFNDNSNVRWLTGFTGSNGTFVVGVSADCNSSLLITDGRYEEQAQAELDTFGCSDQVEVAIARSPSTVAFERFGAVERLGLEVSVSWALQRAWNEKFDAELVPLVEIVEQLRSVKDVSEIARIDAAASIADQALSKIKPRLRPGGGRTELSIQFALEAAMRDLGASAPAFDIIVASGPNSALPHARPTDRPLQVNDLVIVDLGAEVDGYRSDMTRTFLLNGSEPEDVSEGALENEPDGAPEGADMSGRVGETVHALSKSHEFEPEEGADAVEPGALIKLVTRSQAAGIAAIRPGVEVAKVDGACRSVLDEAGLGDRFVHGTGHGVGLDIHELPTVGFTSTTVLEPGHVITVEPGVYLPGMGGVRVEDLVLVTEDGCRLITCYPKYPIHEGWIA